MEDLVFVSVQPDIPYFHWQTKIYVNNFIDKGIKPDKIHVLFVMVDRDQESEESLKLKEGLKTLSIGFQSYGKTEIGIVITSLI